MSRAECTKCGSLYERGYYRDHRMMSEHRLAIDSHTPERSFWSCRICGAAYPPGKSKEHASDPKHIAVLREARHRPFGRAYNLVVTLGLTLEEAGREMGITRERVRQILARDGVLTREVRKQQLKEKRKRQTPRKPKLCTECGQRYIDWPEHQRENPHYFGPNRISPETRAAIIADRKAGYTYPDIKARTGISRSSIFTILSKAGLVSPYAGSRRRKRDRQKILELYEGGASRNQLADIFGVTHRTIEIDIAQARAERVSSHNEPSADGSGIAASARAAPA